MATDDTLAFCVGEVLAYSGIPVSVFGAPWTTTVSCFRDNMLGRQ